MINYQSQNHSITKSHLPRCIILAAGASTRLRPLTNAMPKCLLRVKDKTLLERTIENVFNTGIKEIAIVIGYRPKIIREFLEKRFPHQRFRFIPNPNYATTNNAYSLLLARRFLENKDGKVSHDLLLLDSDILFPQMLLPFLLNDRIKDKIAVRISGEHYEEEIRVTVDKNNNILTIGKGMPLFETYGESIGIEVFSVETTARLFTILEQRIRHGEGRNEFYEAAFQEMIDEGVKLKAVDISAFPAIEIDTLKDFQLAEQMNVV